MARTGVTVGTMVAIGSAPVLAGLHRVSVARAATISLAEPLTATTLGIALLRRRGKVQRQIRLEPASRVEAEGEIGLKPRHVHLGLLQPTRVVPVHRLPPGDLV